MSLHQLAELERQVTSLREEEERRRNIAFSSVTIDHLINFTLSTPEPLHRTKDYYECYNRERICLLVLWCLKVRFPLFYRHRHMRRKICEPLLYLAQPSFRLLRRPEKEPIFGKEETLWWKTPKPSNRSLSETTKKIDKELRDDKERLLREFKVLVMNHFDTGADVLLRQMKILYLNGFLTRELLGFTGILHSTVIQIIGGLIRGCEEFNIALEEENVDLAMRIGNLNTGEATLDQALARDINTLWCSSAIQTCFKQRRSELFLPSNVDNIMLQMDRFAAKGFVPTSDDVIRCTTSPTAMEVFEFDSGMLHFRFVTLGGSRRERKKWAGCFEHETSLMFVVDVSAYDQNLFEDRHISRIQHDRKTFDDVINSKWFRDNDVYLVFNRYDLFKEKIARVDLGTCFADYKEGNDCEKAAAFMKFKFLKLDRTRGRRRIHAEFVTDTDIQCARNLVEAMKQNAIDKQKKEGRFKIN